MMITATTTAAIITGMCWAMPTAVITLSNEKITSISMICTSTAMKLTTFSLLSCSPACPFIFSRISTVAL